MAAYRVNAIRHREVRLCKFVKIIGAVTAEIFGTVRADNIVAVLPNRGDRWARQAELSRDVWFRLAALNFRYYLYLLL